MKRYATALALLLSLVAGTAAVAEVSLPSVVGDHMVLQRDAQARVWGWADAGEQVTVTFAGQTKQAQADADGNWSVTLDPMPASSEGRPLVIAGTNRIELSDVLVGEVWVASGQSNMEWSVQASANPDQERANANHPGIRMWTARRTVAQEPQNDVPGQWQVCSPQTVGGFSAVGYYFARELYTRLDIPVGILHSSWGGTPVEAWTSRPKLDTVDWAGPILERYDTMLAGYDERLAAYHEQLEEYNARRNGPAMTEQERAFATRDFDDSQWQTMALPGNWENRGFEDLDGVMWYRRTVTVPDGWAGKALVLELGPIDDYDVTWFNGVRVGETGANVDQAWQRARVYNIPAEHAAAGEVTLAIRIFDPHGGGGLHGDAAQMKLRPADANVGQPIPLAGDWRYHVAHELDPAQAAENRPPARPVGPDHPHSPAGLYNGMIAPIVPYTIRGAIWYQGESNAGRAQQYEALFPAMIHDWRERWGVGEFPFLFVQLANFRAYSEQPTDTDWTHLQWAQTLTLHNTPNTGMATIIDIGDANDIHPRNKQDVGRRLALWALADTYEQDVVKSGPIYRPGGIEVHDGSANLIFDNFGSELQPREGQLTGFTVAGDDGQFVAAQAEVILNEETFSVVRIWSPDVPNPVHVRYAWKNNPEDANLVNEEGLPAPPFRTDDLPGPTDGRR